MIFRLVLIYWTKIAVNSGAEILSTNVGNVGNFLYFAIDDRNDRNRPFCDTRNEASQ